MFQAADFTLGKVVAYIIFGAIGMGAFVYGKKTASWRPMTIGVVLMGYPYFVSNMVALYLIGSALSAAIYFWRE